jgi:hypothetical protein
MKRVLALVLGAAAFLPGCGGNSGGTIVPIPIQVRITISPTQASVQTGAMLQFMDSVQNTSNMAVTWQVNGTTGGSSTLGTISATGLYTAPAAAPNPAAVTVTVVSQADNTKSASAAVSITSTTGQLIISPSAATVLAGAKQQFSTALAGGGTAQGLTWEVNGTAGGDSTVGTISSAGLYTAPAIPPSGQVVTVTASVVNPAAAASATVTVVPSLATLNGQYAFTFSGENQFGTLLENGSFTADGKGNLASGIEDVNGGSGIFANVPFTGTYTVGKDGRSSLLIIPAAGTGLNTETFDAVLSSNTHARLIRFDSVAAGTGNLDLQDFSSFSLSALSGNYVLNLDGIDSLASPLSAIALVTLDGAGNVTSGQMDSNDNGSVVQGTALTGSYTVASNGRGTMTLSGSLGTFDLGFYVVSAGELRVVSLDGAPVWAGTAAAQQDSNFTTATLHGPFVFAVSGVNVNGPLDIAGQLVASIAGSIISGTGDQNNNGTMVQGSSITGTLTVNSDGYGTLSLAGSSNFANVNYSFYLQSATKAILLGIDSMVETSGSMLAQSQSSFTPASVKGQFGFTVDGVYSGGPIDKLAQFSADGIGTATGTEDVNADGNLNPNLALTATYTVGSKGRGTLKVTAGGSTRVLNLYLASPNEMFMMGLDTDQVLLGLAESQFP